MHDPGFPADASEPSRSQLRRDALDILKLAEALASMPEPLLERLALDDSLAEEVRRTRAVTSHIARKRQTQFLAKQLRRLAPEALAPIRDALSTDREQGRRNAAALHRVERWRERLLAEGDDALAELVAAFPQADRQHLRQLVRNALAERKADKPPRAYRELFHALAGLGSGIGDSGSGS